jgi:A/G-specific adenine glycosylase
LDGNVERVMARLNAVTEPLPDAKPVLRSHAARLTPQRRPGDYAQAVMDLGATICTPRKPRCILCPWRDPCAARRLGIEERLPAKREKPAKPTRQGVAFWAVRADGAVLLRRRPEKGLLGGMMEVPSTLWLARSQNLAEAEAEAPVAARWKLLPGIVRHTFTHFHLEIAVAVGQIQGLQRVDGVWVSIDALGDHALPTIMKKIAHHAIARAPFA